MKSLATNENSVYFEKITPHTEEIYVLARNFICVSKKEQKTCMETTLLEQLSSKRNSQKNMSYNNLSFSVYLVYINHIQLHLQQVRFMFNMGMYLATVK